MKKYSLHNSTRGVVLADRLLVADRFWPRMKGLLGRDRLPAGEGLLLAPCNSVHTMFMRFDIDVVFVSRDFTVVKTVKDLKPWRAASCGRPAFMAMELKAGTIARTGTAAGDRLRMTAGG